MLKLSITNSKKKHLIVLVHGLHGGPYDLSSIRNNILI